MLTWNVALSLEGHRSPNHMPCLTTWIKKPFSILRATKNLAVYNASKQVTPVHLPSFEDPMLRSDTIFLPGCCKCLWKSVNRNSSNPGPPHCLQSSYTTTWSPTFCLLEAPKSATKSHPVIIHCFCPTSCHGPFIVTWINGFIVRDTHRWVHFSSTLSH